MQSRGWIVYEAMGNGKVHLIRDVYCQKIIKANIFCVKKECTFFHVELIQDDIFECGIEHTEQTYFNYVEFLFNKSAGNTFFYSRDNNIFREKDKAVLEKNGIPYLAPELVLLYKSTDILRKESKQDFEEMIFRMTAESRMWLKNALLRANPDGHEWINILNK